MPGSKQNNPRTQHLSRKNRSETQKRQKSAFRRDRKGPRARQRQGAVLRCVQQRPLRVAETLPGTITSPTITRNMRQTKLWTTGIQLLNNNFKLAELIGSGNFQSLVEDRS